MCSVQGCAQIDTDPAVVLQQQGAGGRGCGPTGTTWHSKSRQPIGVRCILITQTRTGGWIDSSGRVHWISLQTVEYLLKLRILEMIEANKIHSMIY